MTTVGLERADQPDVIALIAELDAHQDTLYPPEARHVLDVSQLVQPHVVFAVARDEAGQALGCGAVVLSAAYGEVKRLFVSPRGRGRGVATRLMALLEARATAQGCRVLMLETGPYQTEALALYTCCGFSRRGPFSTYADHPLSVFMQKSVA